MSSAPYCIAQLRHMSRGSHFRASRLHGEDVTNLIDPFLGVDHVWISASTFPPHPHAGFSAVSYLFPDSETGITNRDSLGNHNLISPGGLHWTAAGRGIVHEEVPAETGKVVHMLQIFVNLHRERQDALPFILSLATADTPSVELSGAKIRIPLGSYGDVRSPLTPPTEVGLLDITLDHLSELCVPLAADQSAFVMPVFGSLIVNGEQFESAKSSLPIFPAQALRQSITLRTGEGTARAVLFTGKPLRQPVLWRGSLAMASSTALLAAYLAAERGEFGSLK